MIEWAALERTTLPAVNAVLNSTAAVLLLSGYVAIKSGKESLHKALMIATTLVSALFLSSYLTHHSMFGSTKFTGQGWIRPVYFSILLSHTLLAIVMLPMVLMTFYRAFKNQREEHRKIARWTFPIWLYVSVTGVLVYMLLYQLYPAAQ